MLWPVIENKKPSVGSTTLSPLAQNPWYYHIYNWLQIISSAKVRHCLQPVCENVIVARAGRISINAEGKSPAHRHSATRKVKERSARLELNLLRRPWQSPFVIVLDCSQKGVLGKVDRPRRKLWQIIAFNTALGFGNRFIHIYPPPLFSLLCPT